MASKLGISKPPPQAVYCAPELTLCISALNTDATRKVILPMAPWAREGAFFYWERSVVTLAAIFC